MDLSETSRPLILYAVPPREGHMRPALQISGYLVSRSFEVTIIGTPDWKLAIESVGAAFSPIIGLWNTLDDPSRWPRIAYAPNIEARLAASLDDGFVMLLPSGLETVRIALADIRRRNPGRQIIILSDTCFSGTLALKLGSELPPGFEGESSIKTVGIGLVPVFFADPMRPPWGSGLQFDATNSGRERNLAAYANVHDVAAEERGRYVLDMLSCRKPLDAMYQDFVSHSGLKRPFWDASTLCHNTTLQMGSHCLEYPATDWPENLKFAGFLPTKPLPSNLSYPDWFDEIRRERFVKCSEPSRRKVVLVAQGTEVLDYRDLVLPTIMAFADSDSVLVVAILCVRGASLDPNSFLGGILPANARVLDYFPYDAIMPHADVFVSNSGYGGLTHAIANGIPMVQAGTTFDKPDIGSRIEWSGLGLFLPGPPPSPETIKEAVNRVLYEEKYSKRATELQAEGSQHKPLEMIENEILALVI